MTIRRCTFASAVVFLMFGQAYAQEKAADGGLTTDSLKTVLEGLGQDIEKDVKNKDGKVIGYQVELKQANTVTHPQITLSSDGTIFWVSVALSKCEIDAVPKKILGDMLIANDKMGPYFFHFDNGNNYFHLSTFVLNKNMKPKDVKRCLDGIASNLEAYESLWLQDKWPEAKK